MSTHTQIPSFLRPYAVEPEKLVEMMRENTVTTLDSMLAVQDEARKNTVKTLERLHGELNRWSGLGHQAAEEATAMAFDVLRAGLEKGRDGVARTGKAPEAAATA